MDSSLVVFEGARQWLPFSQSPHLELSPSHYLSPSYQSSFSFDMSSNPPEVFNFSDDEDSEHESVEDALSNTETSAVTSTVEVDPSEVPALPAIDINKTETTEDAPNSFVNLDFASPGGADNGELKTGFLVIFKFQQNFGLVSEYVTF